MLWSLGRSEGSNIVLPVIFFIGIEANELPPINEIECVYIYIYLPYLHWEIASEAYKSFTCPVRCPEKKKIFAMSKLILLSQRKSLVDPNRDSYMSRCFQKANLIRNVSL